MRVIRFIRCVLCCPDDTFASIKLGMLSIYVGVGERSVGSGVSDGLRKPLALDEGFHVDSISSICIALVKTACVLHNFLRTKNCDSLYFENLDPPEPTLGAFVNIENDPRRTTNMAFEIREKFVNVFNN